MRILENVGHSIDAVVARAIGPDEMRGVKYQHEVRRGALGRDIAL